MTQTSTSTMTTPPRALALTAGLCLLAAACSSSGKASDAHVSVNEVLASNATGCADELGERDDWIELYNPGPSAVDLQGFSITDDAGDTKKKVFGAGVSVPGDGVLLLWADDGTGNGDIHLPFKLKAGGESVLLFDPQGALVDELSWTGAIDDVAWARFPDGGDTATACAAPTCGEKNGSACAR